MTAVCWLQRVVSGKCSVPNLMENMGEFFFRVDFFLNEEIGGPPTTVFFCRKLEKRDEIGRKTESYHLILMGFDSNADLQSSISSWCRGFFSQFFYLSHDSMRFFEQKEHIRGVKDSDRMHIADGWGLREDVAEINPRLLWVQRPLGNL